MNNLKLASTLLCAMVLLTACAKDPASDLAVSKMTEEQRQAAPFLALNDDKPGTPVKVQPYTARGKYTIVEYYSPYSPESAYFQPRLLNLAQSSNQLAVRTININRPEVQQVDWQSPVLQDHEIRSLPYFVIFDPQQNLRAHGRPAYTQVMQWIR